MNELILLLGLPKICFISFVAFFVSGIFGLLDVWALEVIIKIVALPTFFITLGIIIWRML